MRQGLTFDDVLLVPKRSAVVSRSHVNTATWLTRRIRLNIPIVSANMDTVTESAMAIAMARAGGIGIIHRWMPIEKQAAEVARVKRSEGYVVDNPYRVPPNTTVREVRRLMEEWDTGGILVVDEEDHLLGIITTRDLLFLEDDHLTVADVMTPRERVVTAPPGTTMEEAKRILWQHRIEKLPLVTEDDVVVGLITAKDIVRREQYPLATKDEKGRLRVGAAIGVRPGFLKRAEALLEAGVDVLVLDIAHGHSDNCLRAIRELRRHFGDDVDLIAGNVATAEGTADLIEAGVDAVKVGIGPGSICVTRMVTGFGVPQVTAIQECARVARPAGIPIIADGGVRNSGDLVKALAAGASCVMIGSLLAGTSESPGRVVIRNGRRYKIVRGMASLTANIDRQEVADEVRERGQELDWEKVVPEGVEAVVPYRGSVAEVLEQLVGGLRSGLSYGGAFTIEELWDNAEFIQITPAGLHESQPHDVEPIM